MQPKHSTIDTNLHNCNGDSQNACSNTIKKNSECLTLSYYIDQNKTLELLNFILNGQKKADIVYQDSKHIKLMLKPSIWPFSYSVDIILNEENRSVQICTNNSSGWFNKGNDFAYEVYNNYLNVAQIG